MQGSLRAQVRQERLAGVILIAAAVAALIAANSPARHAYEHLLHLDVGLAVPHIGALTVHSFVADGLMAIFFLLVGMEVKREFIEGRLSHPLARRLPILAAVAGMVVPALVYLLVVQFDPQLMRGWAVPTATDIAFAVAVLAILGSHSPPSIKLLLVSVAVVDDVGAVAIIALAYTEQVDTLALGAAAILVGLLALLNMMGVRRGWPYLAGFALLWWLVSASGVHSTIAGVLAALTIPLGAGDKHSTLEHLEHRLRPWAMFAIVPLFGFVSAGFHLPPMSALFEPLPLAVLLGLFVGKQLGVFAAIRIGDAMGVCCRPEGASWTQIYGASILCGVGFTMSLFVGAIAAPDQPEFVEAAKIGTLVGSLLAALLGWVVLRSASPVPWVDDDAAAALRLFGFSHQDARRRGAAFDQAPPEPPPPSAPG